MVRSLGSRSFRSGFASTTITRTTATATRRRAAAGRCAAGRCTATVATTAAAATTGTTAGTTRTQASQQATATAITRTSRATASGRTTRRGATTTATMTGVRFALATHQHNADNGEEHRKTKYQSTIHPRILQHSGTVVRDSRTVVLDYWPSFPWFPPPGDGQSPEATRSLNSPRKPLTLPSPTLQPQGRPSDAKCQSLPVR